MQDEMEHDELLKKESQLWGGFSRDDNPLQSPVKLSVVSRSSIVDDVKMMPNGKDIDANNNPLSKYVLFPLQSETKKEIMTEAEFTLLVSMPEKYLTEVEQTLKLWTLFGGVGARTRRGCGSVYCESLMRAFTNIDSVQQFLKNSARGGEATFLYPRIAGAQLYSTEGKKNIKSLQDSYGKYRQNRAAGSGGGEPTGRSYWPEPDAIRRVKKKNASLHEPEHPDAIWFRRAAFGLPIMTEFNSKSSGNGKKDPSVKISLKPTKASRWPSPMILKMVRLGNGKEISIMLVLNHKFPESISLDNQELDKSAHPDNTRNKVMINNPNEKQLVLNGRGVYQALADYLGMKEVG
ncbi:hypothetical protein JCM12856_31460 [Spirochaeta dissipatitropha]